MLDPYEGGASRRGFESAALLIAAIFGGINFITVVGNAMGLVPVSVLDENLCGFVSSARIEEGRIETGASHVPSGVHAEDVGELDDRLIPAVLLT